MKDQEVFFQPKSPPAVQALLDETIRLAAHAFTENQIRNIRAVNADAMDVIAFAGTDHVIRMRAANTADNLRAK